MRVMIFLGTSEYNELKILFFESLVVCTKELNSALQIDGMH